MRSLFKNSAFLLLAAGLLAAMPLTAFAQNNQLWTGTNSSDFGDPGNWSNGAAGLGMDILEIGTPGLTNLPIISADSQYPSEVARLDIGHSAWGATGSGTLTQTGGAMTYQTELVVGGNGGFPTSEYELQGGTLTQASAGFSTNDYIGIGGGNSGRLDMSGASVYNRNGNTEGGAVWNDGLTIGSSWGGTGTMTMTGTAAGTPVFTSPNVPVYVGRFGSNTYGSLILGGTGASFTTMGLAVGADDANGTITIGANCTVSETGGAWGGGVLFGGSGGTGTLNLNGGTFAVTGIWTQFSSTGVFNFNGGVLQALADNTDFMSKDPTAVRMALNVLANGAIIDTNSHNITIQQPFLNGTGGGADGGLTKINPGTLTLTAASTYTGPTALNAGQIYLSGSLCTGSLAMQPGTTLNLANANPFAGATAAVSVATGATLVTNLIGSAAVSIGANANVTFGDKSFLSIATDGSNLSTLVIGNLGGTGKVIVGIVGAAPVSGPLLSYSSAVGGVPIFLPRYDSVGMTDFSVTNDGANINANLTYRGLQRGFVGETSGLSNTDLWTQSLWAEPGVPVAGFYPHTGADKAWFNQSVYAGVTNNAILNTSVTLSSMLFNGSFTVSKVSPTATETITLSSTIAADSQIQAVAGNSSVAPDILMAAGDPLISVAGGASLTLNGALSDAVVGQSAGVTITGPGTLTLNGTNTYTGPTVLQGGLLQLGNASALGASASTFTVAGGTITDAGADIVVNHGFTIAGAATIAPANNLTFTGAVAYQSGSFTKLGAGTLTFDPASATTNSFGTGGFHVQAGTLTLEGPAGTVYHAGAPSNDVNIAAGSPPAGANATVIVTGHASFVDDNWLIMGDTKGTTGSLTIADHATMSVAGNGNIGNNYGPDGYGAGHITVQDNAAFSINGVINFGTWGVGTLDVKDNATFTANSDIAVGKNWGDTYAYLGQGTVTIAGGTVTVTGLNNGDNGNPGTIVLGAIGSYGEWHQNGGLTTCAQPVVVGEYDYWDGDSGTPGTGVLYLNGGTFTAPQIVTRSAPGKLTVTGTVNFNGGTLQASANSSDFITVVGGGPSLLTLNVQSGGAVIDSNGYAITINQPLVAASPDGGVTKAGAGTLTLTAADTYTGLTVVKKGTLKLTEAASEAVLHTTTTGLGADIQGGYLVFDYKATGNTPVDTIRANLLSSYTTGSGTMSGGKMFTSTGALSGYGIGYVDDPVAQTVTAQVAVFGDANLDGTVNLLDLTALANHWKQTGYWAQGDFNYDGTVNLLDLTLLAAHWKKSLTGITFDQALAMVGMNATAPEPGTMVLLGCGLFGLLAYAWRKRK